MAYRCVITDIEGTTTPISFVKNVLFPYAARALPAFMQAHADVAAVREQLNAVADEADLPHTAPLAQLNDVLQAWIAADRKVTPLKALQGMVWRTGYERGDLRAPVYDDVPAALARWRSAGIKLYVYSSGSVEAQQLLFRYSDHGDLTPLFNGWFDTRIGAKQEPGAYRAIAAAIDAAPAACLFLSDVAAELDAAAKAGMGTVQLIRPGDGAMAGSHRQVSDFARIDPLAAPASL
jgi:enolase-phosphatase E1